MNIEKFNLPFKAVYIQCLDKDNAPISGKNATGFIRKEEDGFFLYTCWHVVTGYKKYDLEIPNELPNRFSLKITLQDTDSNNSVAIKIGGNQSLTIPLYDISKDPKIPLWFQDKQNIPQTDLNLINIYVPFWHDAVKLRLPDNIIVSDMQTIKKNELFN